MADPGARTPPYKLLVTDLDGTLLDDRGAVHPRDLLAIRELVRRGVAVSICTGRMYSGTRAIARELGLHAPIGCLDGSHIVDAGTDRALLMHSIEAVAATALVTILAEHRPATFVFSGDAVFHDEQGDAFLSYVRTWSQEVKPLDDVLAHASWSGDRPMAALVALGEQLQIEAAEQAIVERHPEELQTVSFGVRREGYDGLWGMVVRAAGATKATAVSWIAAHHGIEIDQVVAVGDWLNDIPMLRAAGRSFAMNQAPIDETTNGFFGAWSDSRRGIMQCGTSSDSLTAVNQHTVGTWFLP
jgi:hypothetical protein